MKTFKVGISVVAILLVVPGIGFGIAQAGGSDWNLEALDSYFEYVPENRPVLSFEDLEPGSSSSYAESRPVLSFDDEERLAKSPAEGMQLQNPIEAGSLPSGSDAESSIIGAGGVKYRVGIDTGP